MDDLYVSNAPIHAVLGAPFWAAAGPVLQSVLDDRVAGPGVIVDVGSGAGLALPWVVRARPHAELVAVEPSEIMRAGLTATVVAHRLTGRTTVIEGDLDSLIARGWQDRWQAVVAVNVLGHLEAGPAARMLRTVAERLTDDGVVVVGLHPPFESVRVPLTDFGEERCGRFGIVSSGRCESDGREHVVWHMRWDVREGGTTVRRREQRIRWRIIGPEDLESMAAGVGLRTAVVDAGLNLFALRRG